jgi:hypothetical protein
MKPPALPPIHASEHFAVDDDFGGGGALLAGERVGPPLPRTRGNPIVRILGLLVVLGAGWALATGQVALPKWLLAEIAAAISSREGAPAAPLPPVTQAAAAPLPPVSQEPARELPRVSPQPPAASEPAMPATAAEPASPPRPAASGAGETAAEPLVPPSADPADPYQVKALAVGLHPDLSRALLTRLSPADYHNAGVAIRKALAETSDSAVFVWPRQRKPELALFQVHFVPGAAPSCRRYVVTVTKDGWSTTAPPMERCGSAANLPQRGPHGGETLPAPGKISRSRTGGG